MEVYWLLPVKATKGNIKTMLNENGNFWMQNHNTNTIHKYFTYTVTLSMNNIMCRRCSRAGRVGKIHVTATK